MNYDYDEDCDKDFDDHDQYCNDDDGDYDGEENDYRLQKAIMIWTRLRVWLFKWELKGQNWTQINDDW